jgi:hypothetical protein
MIKTIVTRTTRSRRPALVASLSVQVSASRHPAALSSNPTPIQGYTTWSSLRKGKQRDDGTTHEQRSPFHLAGLRWPGHVTLRLQSRSFHSTRPRLAVPLIPAGFAILKVSEAFGGTRSAADLVVRIRTHSRHPCSPSLDLVLPHWHDSSPQIP